MEKKEKNTFDAGPWIMRRDVMKSFAQVTPDNRNAARVIGRIMYVIEKIGISYKYRGNFVIEPLLEKGWYNWPFKPWVKKPVGETHFKVFIPENMNAEEWKNAYKALLDKFIGEETLYIRPSDPILKFYKENK